ncbi:AmmeMemoRadiSam system radical SAM enzyme [Candidatus Kuenenbacteria bacterium]|nr:AmmeMemoRadiSam system radical SAM enzyme [Candidatus Kuenenbacteria bacterium]
MKEALLYTKESNRIVHCLCCEHHCVIRNGAVGVCNVRKNEDGKLYSLVYGKIIAQHVDPIEKKPLYHFLKGSLTYSIATVGCNFKCKHCQNADIAQFREHVGEEDWIPGALLKPVDIVRFAGENNCESIAYTYTEPTIFVQFALETMKLARQAGLKNVWVSNGYFSNDTFELIKYYLDAINIDLKFFNDLTYKQICGAKLEPVLRSIRSCVANNIHTEVTTLVIPGMNDSNTELHRIADFLYNVDPEIVWHLSAFYPASEMKDVSPTSIGTLNRALKIGLAAGLKNVYLGNV